jgi:Ni/Co efflux regulator RcnB
MKRLVTTLLAAATLAGSLPAAALADGPRGRGWGADSGWERRDDHDRRGYWDRRGGHHGRWNRNDRYWWRGHPDWRGYDGRRHGYWYAPGYGYYSVESRWYGHAWRRGEYMPGAYRRYHVRDPYFYGLRPAPRGYAWIYAGGDLVLVSLSSGLILDVLLNVY